MDCSFLNIPQASVKKLKREEQHKKSHAFQGHFKEHTEEKKKKILSKQKDHSKGKPKRKRSLLEKRCFLEEKTHEKVLFLVMKQAVFSLKKRGASLIAPLTVQANIKK